MDVLVGLPCAAAAVGSRLVFTDDDTWAHNGLRWAAFALLTWYSIAAVKTLLTDGS
jgi:hypothetical protein